ncbi:MAG: bi-domain-containing oxidoreductase [Pseudomonadota bacterium]
MKQIIQSLKDGTVELAEVPAPLCGSRELLIRTRRSLISVGTERMLLEFGKANWINKARQQPDKVRQTLDKVRTDGLAATVDAVRAKLDQPIPLGYCNVGTVIEAGDEIVGIEAGDRVVSNGHHAEIVTVGQNLSARVPEAVSDDHAAFTVLGAIGLQGIRLAAPTLGESVAVIGLGLIGLLTVQMLRAQGCRALAIDLDPAKLELARKFGAQTVAASDRAEVLDAAQAFSRGRGVDAVLITAATSSNEPVTQAAQMSRQRGRIVLVGVTGLELSRADFYEKELTFQVSCSYGPGRYDASYEDQGNDYPFGLVRWTEQRNFEAVLDLMAAGALDLDPLISHRFAFDEAPSAYDDLDASLGVLLDYPVEESPAAPERLVQVGREAGTSGSGAPRVAFIGAGNYGGRVLLPAFEKAGARLEAVVSARGISATHHAKKLGIAKVSTDAAEAMQDPEIDAVVISTRHNLHAEQVLAALAADKHVFVEKPICLSLEDLGAIERAMAEKPNLKVIVGFNRRFSPLTVTMQDLLSKVSEPKSFIMTVNAGSVPADSWLHDPEIGGGRVVGEGCHFIDLLRCLTGSPVVAMRTDVLNYGEVPTSADRLQITLTFGDGSVGTIFYLANGHKGFPKERLEVFCAGRVLQMDNFRSLRGWGWPGFTRQRLWRQDKGQTACVAAFCEAIRTGGPSPIPADEILEVSRLSVEAEVAARAGGSS